MRNDDQVTTKSGERRRIHGSKSLSHFCLLCTDRSQRRAHETFLHLHHFSMQVRAAQYPGSRVPRHPPPHSPLLFLPRPPSRPQQANMWPTVHRRCWPTLPSKLSGSGVAVGRLLYHSQRLPRHKQLIQLRMAVSLDVQRILEHTIGIAPDTSLTVTEVLDTLQSHFKSQRNEALRRRELLCLSRLTASHSPISSYA
ncbi:hypothetical protein GWK47_008063 [Chionoecetes opilio]|uniref:Uncharacterized protein n=1 Tax=Chionoecetes opilio TaxID=41210 RepID=A0A8J4Y9N5_CHIOP|nr:hypothetical protein GWK47_008063 [Chionoecetes opilio]